MTIEFLLPEYMSLVEKAIKTIHEKKKVKKSNQKEAKKASKAPTGKKKTEYHHNI